MFFFDDQYLENIALIDRNGSFLSYFDLTAEVFSNSNVWIKTKFQSLVFWP